MMVSLAWSFQLLLLLHLAIGAPPAAALAAAEEQQRAAARMVQSGATSMDAEEPAPHRTMADGASRSARSSRVLQQAADDLVCYSTLTMPALLRGIPNGTLGVPMRSKYKDKTTCTSWRGVTLVYEDDFRNVENGDAQRGTYTYEGSVTDAVVTTTVVLAPKTCAEVANIGPGLASDSSLETQSLQVSMDNRPWDAGRPPVPPELVCLGQNDYSYLHVRPYVYVDFGQCANSTRPWRLVKTRVASFDYDSMICCNLYNCTQALLNSTDYRSYLAGGPGTGVLSPGPSPPSYYDQSCPQTFYAGAMLGFMAEASIPKSMLPHSSCRTWRDIRIVYEDEFRHVKDNRTTRGTYTYTGSFTEFQDDTTCTASAALDNDGATLAVDGSGPLKQLQTSMSKPWDLKEPPVPVDQVCLGDLDYTYNGTTQRRDYYVDVSSCDGVQEDKLPWRLVKTSVISFAYRFSECCDGTNCTAADLKYFFLPSLLGNPGAPAPPPSPPSPPPAPPSTPSFQPVPIPLPRDGSTQSLPPPPEGTAASSAASSSSSSTTGAAVGAAVGGTVALIAAGGLLVVWRRRRAARPQAGAGGGKDVADAGGEGEGDAWARLHVAQRQAVPPPGRQADGKEQGHGLAGGVYLPGPPQALPGLDLATGRDPGSVLIGTALSASTATMTTAASASAPTPATASASLLPISRATSVVPELTPHMRIRYDELKDFQQIGQGGFGDAFKCKWRGREVVVKMVRPDLATDTLRAALIREALLMRELQNPGVARVYGVVDEAPHHALVMQLYKRGTLDEFMTRPATSLQYNSLSVMQRLRMAEQVADGMAYLHQHAPPIVHGDLKPANLLVDLDGSIAITDFGLAVQLMASSGSGQGQAPAGGHPASPSALCHLYRTLWTSPSLALSVFISPPEVLADHNAPRSTATDVYAFGITLLQIVMGRMPYKGLSADMVINMVKGGKRPPVPEWVPPGVQRLIEDCWAQDPNARPSMERVAERIKAEMEALGSTTTLTGTVAATTTMMPNTRWAAR